MSETARVEELFTADKMPAHSKRPGYRFGWKATRRRMGLTGKKLNNSFYVLVCRNLQYKPAKLDMI